MKIVQIKGGLGNRMFQYAFYEALKKSNKNVRCTFDRTEVERVHKGLEIDEVFKNVKIRNYKRAKFFISMNPVARILRKLSLIKIYSFNDSKYQEEVIEDKTKVVFYNGYWQSEKFFKAIEKEIREKFTFPKLNNENIEIGEKILEVESVSVHVRRGDYLNNPFLGGIITEKYYQNAFKIIEDRVKNPVYFIFSDDIKWCKESLDLGKRKYYFINNNKDKDSYRDMQLMSMCKHNIIPNSSFSWWGAWLNTNPNKIVIAPSKWFTDSSKLNYEDIIPENWLKIYSI